MADVPPDTGIIAFVPDPWGATAGTWQSREHLLTRLARHFPLVWFDPPLEWRAWWLPGNRRVGPVAEPPPADQSGFIWYRPGRFLPRVYRPRALGAWLERRRLAEATALLRHRGVRRIVLYLWRPEFAPVLNLIPHALSCYHIDDEYTFSEVDVPVPVAEADLLRRVDQVFIHSPALVEKKGGYNPHTMVVPNGVDLAAFRERREAPADLRDIPHPRLGYVGVIKEQLDIPLLRDLARARPDWSFVMVGPSRLTGADAAAFAEMSGWANVHALGSRPLRTLPAYLQHLDVGLLPYRETAYTNCIFPLKLPEYLAAGLPVVGTPIRSLREFRGDLRLARSPDAWIQAAGEAIADRDPGARDRRRESMQPYDWERLAAGIADTFRRRLEEVGR